VIGYSGEIYRACVEMRRGDEKAFVAGERVDIKDLLALSLKLAEEQGVCISFYLTGQDMRARCFRVLVR
jgi:hypothetical protein